MPKSVKVGPVEYEILRSLESFSDKGHDPCYGETEHFESRISIHPTLSGGQARATLLHEVLHCILNQSQLRLSDAQEEKVVRALDCLLLDTIERNPDLREYLFSG